MRSLLIVPPVTANGGTTYALAPNGIFWSLQGEGHLRGMQMAFVRLAGCSVGCVQCDTDYSVASRCTLPEIIRRVEQIVPAALKNPWLWITGGEPTDHALDPLIHLFTKRGYRIAIATAGYKPVTPPIDWLSVSPHQIDRCQQRFGHEIKIVHGLGALQTKKQTQEAMSQADKMDFWFRYLQPVSNYDVGMRGYGVSMRHLDECKDLLKEHPNWGLSLQDHHSIGVP